jgi:hypothetical protein
MNVATLSKSPGWAGAHFPAGIASMNRSIVTIEPALAGWVVSFEGRALQVLPSKLEAIGFASRRAAEQHLTSGAPCGVSVRLRTGETVLVALHGWEGQTVRGSLR